MREVIDEEVFAEAVGPGVGSGVRLLLLYFIVQPINLSSKRLVLGDPRGESSDQYSHRCRVPPKISRHFAQCVSLSSNQYVGNHRARLRHRPAPVPTLEFSAVSPYLLTELLDYFIQ